MRKYKVPHQQLIHWLLIHPGQPVMECMSETESGTRNYYWSVFGSKAIVTVTVVDENLYYELLSAASIVLDVDDIEEI